MLLCRYNTAQAGDIFPTFPLQKDKQLHLAAGFIISGTSSFIAKKLNWRYPVLIGFGIGTLAGIGKELYDLTGRGDPTVPDAVATSLGSIAGSLTFGIKINFHKKNKTNSLPILD